MAPSLDLRRFTALDMHGGTGSLRRRRIIRAEFVLGCVVTWLFGAFLLASGAWLIGLWILGVGVNYIPLAVYSIVMYPATASNGSWPAWIYRPRRAEPV